MAEHGHAATVRGLDMRLFGFLVFLASEGMIFLTVFSTRFLLAGTSRPPAVDEAVGAAITALMLLSAAPSVALLRASVRGDAQAAARATLLALVSAAVLLAGVVWEATSLEIGAGTRYGGTYVLALGLHAAHVAAAVLLFGGVALAQRRRRAASTFAAEAAAAFWLFVVAMWIGLYTTFYLL